MRITHNYVPTNLMTSKVNKNLFMCQAKIDPDHGYVLFNQECFLVFHNLIHLELNYYSNMTWHLVFEMFKHFPKLQTFCLLRLCLRNCPLSRFGLSHNLFLNAFLHSLKSALFLIMKGRCVSCNFQEFKSFTYYVNPQLTISYTNSSN